MRNHTQGDFEQIIVLEPSGHEPERLRVAVVRGDADVVLAHEVLGAGGAIVDAHVLELSLENASALHAALGEAIARLRVQAGYGTLSEVRSIKPAGSADVARFADAFRQRKGTGR